MGAFVRFQTQGQRPLLMKIGLSYTSVEGARRNLKAECAHWDFDRVVRESTDDWNTHLTRITVEGGSDAQKTKFYTDLWRSLLGRRVVSDVDGAYSDMKAKRASSEQSLQDPMVAQHLICTTLMPGGAVTGA